MSTSTEEFNTFFPEPRILKIADREKKEVVSFEINEFVLENRTKFVRIMAEIFTDFAKTRPHLVNSGTAIVIANLIDVAGEKFGEIYALVLGADLQWLKKNLTLKNEVELLTAIFEVNDIPLLIGQVQQSIERMSAKV